jgi:hypothetical protein
LQTEENPCTNQGIFFCEMNVLGLIRYVLGHQGKRTVGT